MFFVSMLSRYTHSTTKKHVDAAKTFMSYVVGTVKFGIWYSKDVYFSLKGYIDRDWAGSIDNKKSTSVNVFNLGSRVSFWILMKNDLVALSSAEEEYVCVSLASCQDLWL